MPYNALRQFQQSDVSCFLYICRLLHWHINRLSLFLRLSAEHSWRGLAKGSDEVSSFDEHHVTGAQARRVVACARTGRLAFAPVLPGQIEAHGADSEKEE